MRKQLEESPKGIPFKEDRIYHNHNTQPTNTSKLSFKANKLQKTFSKQLSWTV